MLEANKKEWFEKIFTIYNKNLLQRRFRAFRVKGIENLNNFPLIIFCNHSSWWDGLAVYHIMKITKLDQFFMMEEKQLKKLQFFRKIGAFSVVRESPRQAVESMNYAADLLKIEGKRALIIFPQGKILPNDIRPLELFNGISRIVQKLGKCNVQPLAIRYEFFGEWKPEILVKIGKSQIINAQNGFNHKLATEQLAEQLTDLLDSIKEETVSNNLQNYQNII